MPTKSTEDIITSLIEFANKRKITISKEEILKIANLVRIQLSEDEVEFYSKELTMLDWIHDILSKVNTEGVDPIRYGSIEKNIHVRNDTSNSENMRKEILCNTCPDDGYFVVPKILD